MVSTEVFDVLDKQITRVKKKKIYKKRNEEKILVRIIKNHCNKNGDVVKTETIVIDEQPGTNNEDETSNMTMKVKRIILRYWFLVGVASMIQGSIMVTVVRRPDLSFLVL